MNWKRSIWPIRNKLLKARASSPQRPSQSPLVNEHRIRCAERSRECHQFLTGLPEAQTSSQNEFHFFFSWGGGGSISGKSYCGAAPSGSPNLYTIPEHYL